MTTKERLKKNKEVSSTVKNLVKDIDNNQEVENTVVVDTAKEIVNDIEDKTVNTEKQTVKEVPKSVRKLVNRDMEIAIMNNTHAGFIYVCPRTQNRYEMTGYGDMDYMTVGELLTMKNSHRSILDNYWIVIVDVLDDSVELDDVIKYLGLEELYTDVLTKDEVDKLIMKSTIDNFKKAITSMNKPLADRIIERALMLFKEGKFVDYAKCEVIKSYTKNDMIFDILSNEDNN